MFQNPYFLWQIFFSENPFKGNKVKNILPNSTIDFLIFTVTMTMEGYQGLTYDSK